MRPNVKTPPGIGRRFDSVVQRSLAERLQQTRQNFNDAYGAGIASRLEMLRPRMS